VLAVVPGGHRLDMHKVRDATGDKTTRLASEDDLEATSPITSWGPRRRLPAFSTCAASWIRRSDRGNGSCSLPVPTPTLSA
jgi:hypothetical protein